MATSWGSQVTGLVTEDEWLVYISANRPSEKVNIYLGFSTKMVCV